MEEKSDINNDNLKSEYINLSIDEDTRRIINCYFDGKFTSNEMIDYIKKEYSNFKES